MNAAEWKEKAQARLRAFAAEAGRWTPGLLYGGLAASAVFPLVEATGQAMATGNFGLLMSLGSLAGSLVGGNLLADQISRWHERTEAEIAAELAANAESDPDWRDALDELLLKFDAPQIVQAVLPERDWDRFQGLLQSELAKLGNSEKYVSYFVNTGGGANIEGGVTMNGGNFAGRDLIINPPAPDPAIAATETARQRYLERLRQRCNVLPLAPLGGDDSGEDVTLDDVYVALDTQSRVKLTDAEKKKRESRFSIGEDGDSRPVTALEAAGRSRRLVLLGDPGGGKSTFVRQMCGRQAGTLAAGQPTPAGFPSDWPADLLPLLVVIREIAPRLVGVELAGISDDTANRRLAGAFWQHWQDELAQEGAEAYSDELGDRLRSGQVLLVLDGFDEVSPGQRLLVRRAISGLLGYYPRLQRVILTCRVRSYTDAVRLTGFDEERLALFGNAQIGAFVAAWYAAQNRQGRFTSEKAGERTQDLTDAARSADLRELAANPMLLTTMAIIHQKEVGLPKERVRLYDQAVKVLVERWQKHRGLPTTPGLTALLADDLKLRSVLERLAHIAHSRSGSQAPDLPRGELMTLLERSDFLGSLSLAGEFLDYVDQRAGLLVGQGGDAGEQPQSYAFPHRTFQEYLAGCALLRGRGMDRTYWQKAGEGDLWPLAGLLGAEELIYNKDRPTELLDLAYALCPETPATDDQGWRAMVWSAQMAVLLGREAIESDSEKPGGGRGWLDRLRNRTAQLLEEGHLTPIERAEGGRALGVLGDPRPGVGVVRVRYIVPVPDIDWIAIPAGPFVMGSDKSIDTLAYGDEMPQFTNHLITEAYRIARYPVTVAQYGCFVQAGGYAERQWWTEAGWQWREKNGISGPEHYREIFQTPNHPVVGVSWYEAVAFCHWLSEQVGYRVELPSESQWERAARHTDARVYPWNREFAPERCNMVQTGIGATSAVGIFPSGHAECGAADMSGNVWEWCSTVWRDNYEAYAKNVLDDPTDKERRCVRGGSWGAFDDDVRCASRSFSFPSSRTSGSTPTAFA